MTAGLPNNLLRVDLTDQRLAMEAVPETWQQHFIGGKGLGARYLYDAVGPDIDPLAPENVLLLLIGPLSGYLPGSDRVVAVTKSPLTGLFLDSYAGGSFARALRHRFPEGVGIRLDGSTQEPQYLDLRGEPKLVNAAQLVGETIDTVTAGFDDASVATIGPAGEVAVPFATIAIDGGEHHAGRGGAGAVMGSKGLKAIVAPEPPAQLDSPTPAIANLREIMKKRLTESPYGQTYQRSGTLESLGFADAAGILPTHGWQSTRFADAERLGLDAVSERATGREQTDPDVPGDFRVPTEEGETVVRGGTPIALGATLGIDDFDAVATLGATCDRLGVDVISAGNVIALAVLASEAGQVKRNLSFGDPVAVKELLSEIATISTPLGTILAQGVERAAHELDMEAVIPTVKQMAVPSFDPRGAPAMALAYATSDRGACHRRSVPATVSAFTEHWTSTQIAQAIAAEQDRRAALWCLIIDDVTAPAMTDLGTDWLAALGLTVTEQQLRDVGTRTWTLTRLFNVREGVTREADSLPAVFTRAADPPGSVLSETAFTRTLDRYYELRDWDVNGIPSQRLLERVGLDAVIDETTPVGGHPLHDQPK